MYMEVKKVYANNFTLFMGLFTYGSSHPEGNKLVEDIKDVWIEVLCEQQRLQCRAVPLHLVREDISKVAFLPPTKRKGGLILIVQGNPNVI